MNTLYITSFNEKLYNKTGNLLLKSYINTKQTNKLLIINEGAIIKESSKNFYIEDLDNDWVLNFFNKNKDIISIKYGGLMRINKNSVEMCYQQHNFNEQAFRWFKKISAIRTGYLKYREFDSLIFVDSDAIFMNYIPQQKIDEFLAEYDLFYHLGQLRKRIGTGIESGIIGFNLSKQGSKFLEEVFTGYENGDFRRSPRWDDGFYFRYILETNNIYHGNDLARDLNVPDVIDFGPFKKLIKHFKGIHCKSNII